MVGSTALPVSLPDVTVQTNEGNKIVENISQKHYMITGLVISDQIKPWHIHIICMYSIL